MWGVRRRGYRYYLCHPAHQRGQIPSGHPRTVYINEQTLLGSITELLATRLYGPDRLAFWQDILATEPPEPNQPLQGQIAQLERTATQVQTRLRRQILNLEAVDLGAEARRRIAERISELEHELQATQAAITRLHGQQHARPPDSAALPELLAELPLNGQQLQEATRQELWKLFVSLDLRVGYDHARHKAKVSVTLGRGKPNDSCQSGQLRRHGTTQCYNPPLPVRLSAKIRLRARYQRECVSRR